MAVCIYNRLWRSWITQRIPIPESAGSNPVRRAKKFPFQRTGIFYPSHKLGISSMAQAPLYLITPTAYIKYSDQLAAETEMLCRNND